MIKKFLSDKLRFLLWSLVVFSFFCFESSYAQLTTKSTIASSNGAEISAFDPSTNRVFTVAGNAIEYYTLSSTGVLSIPTNIPYGFTVAAGSTAIPNSVAVKNGVLVFGFAVVVTTTNAQQPGRVVFYNPATATYISDVTVGYLPDMVAFSPDGTKILTANEGEPNSYNQGTSFDPEGSVSIIDISGGIASATVSTASFTSFNPQMASLKASGVRIYGPNATVAQDLEPEYVTFIDNATAAVTLQENNAVAIVDIATATVTTIYPLGLKDHSLPGSGLDASDRDLTSTTGTINIQNWPVKGMYMPDAIASFTSGANTYFITANEGDSRAYTGYTEEIRVGAAGYVLDPAIFPTAATLKLNANLGRLQLSNATGNTDGDGDFDEIHALGARSFTIWNNTFTKVFDSGDQLEQITASQNAADFNSDGTAATFDTRSDNKGPEPEGVTTGTVNGVQYAFVGSERTGDVFVYDITIPTAPVFKQYINTAADTGVEGIIFVPAAQSPTGNALVITSAETSKTVSVYEFTPPTITVTAGTISCNGATTTVTISATAGTAPYTGTGTFTVGAGTYSYTVTDANGLTATASVTISQPATALVASSTAGTITCNGTTTVTVTAAGGTAPYTGTGTFTLGAGAYSYTVTDANGCTSTTTGTVVSIPDTTNPTIYFQPSTLLPGVTGPSTTQTPYLLPQATGGKFTSIFSVNDVVGGYRMVGIPDGLGAYDNNNGTFTLLMNHEIGNSNGIIRAHGSIGAFVSKWVINKSNLAVQSGSDLIQTVNTWSTSTSSFVIGTTQFNRFCSADLPSVPALFNAATGLGTQERIFLTGEESGSEGRAFGHIATGASAGVSYQLPYLGRFSWENVVASPASGNKTVVAGTDDATTNGQVYFYIGTKTNSGTEIDKAGLNNGKLYGVKVPSLPSELSASIPAANTAFTLEDLGFVQNKTGVTLNTESVTAGVTNFLRPEDGGFDPSNPNDFYFVTTNAFTLPSRMWRLRFNDIANPETGGTITAVLDGTEGQKMLDNMTIDKFGHILLQEDPGGQAHNAKMWQYTIATDALELVGKHDPARFGDLVAAVTTPATLPFNNDEESSGIIDMSDILGPGMFMLDDQAHYTTGLANLTEVVQGGQLLAFFNPASVSATALTAAPATITSCSGTGINLGTPATADNCSITSVTNDAPSTFPVGTTTVTWTVTDSSSNASTATQTVIVTYLTASTTITSATPYFWSVSGLTYASSGVYTFNTVNESGCTVINTLNLTITVPTFIVGTSCGATISGLNVTINTPVVSGATSYTFRLTNLDTMAPSQTVVRPVNNVALSNTYFPGITLGTNYQIEVSVNAGPFGPPCTVRTPAPTSTIGAHCGTTVTSMSQYVYCTAASSVTGYRFRVTNLITNGVTIVDSSLNRFSFTQVPLPVRAFGATYLIEVALRNTDGSYLPYSVGCTISTPAFPTTSIRPIQCGNYQATSLTESFVASIVATATKYRFRLKSVVPVGLSSATIDRLVNSCSLSMFPALPAGTACTIEVSLEIGGVFGPYGSACTIITPGLTKAAPVVSNEFKAIAYPNPFASDFMFDVKTSSESAIQIRVYDMLGKQVDNRNVEVADIENLQIGVNYPSGVYNVIVSQGENMQTLRVIKR